MKLVGLRPTAALKVRDEEGAQLVTYFAYTPFNLIDSAAVSEEHIDTHNLSRLSVRFTVRTGGGSWVQSILNSTIQKFLTLQYSTVSF